MADLRLFSVVKLLTRFSPAALCAFLIVCCFVSLQHGASAQAYSELTEDQGFIPIAGVVEGSDGAFYGTAFEGYNGYGAMYNVTSDGSCNTLYNFSALDSNNFNSDGAYPNGGLVEGSDGDFYGTTSQGGASGNGTVFKVTSSGTLTTLYTFSGADGAAPEDSLIWGGDGYFYGTTAGGGSSSDGTVFKITPGGILTTLYTFSGSDGKYPYGGLVKGSDGNFYGTTPNGGASGYGTVFKITSSETFTNLHSFSGIDGESPYDTLVQGTDGNFYGTTEFGGANSTGTLFEMTPSGALTSLYSFTSEENNDPYGYPNQNVDGAHPQGGLVEGTDGCYYGTATDGGDYGNGTLFEINPSELLAGKSYGFTELHSFGGEIYSGPYSGYLALSNPQASLILGRDGSFYGTCAYNGLNNDGGVFRLTPSPVITSFTPAAGQVGSQVTINGGNFVGVTSVKFSGISATFNVVSGSQITAIVPVGAATGNLQIVSPGGQDVGTFGVIPTVTSFTPASGGAGASVTITGTGFTGATGAQFGGVSAASFSVQSDTSATASVPVGAVTGPISIVNTYGAGSSTTSFTVIPTPVITSFTPTAGPPGTVVTITGQYFTNASAVAFNGFDSSSFQVVSPTTITATVTEGSSTGPISVTTTPGSTGISSSSFTVSGTPIISSFSPASGGAGTIVTITGSNFTGATGVQFGGVSVKTFTVQSDTSLTAYVPVGAVTGPINIVNAVGPGTSTTSFTVIPTPVITSFTPSSGPPGTVVTITGKYFTNASAVTFNGIAASSFQVVSATSITATVSTSASTGPIALRTPGGKAQSPGAYTVTGTPTITSFSPASGGAGTLVTIKGTNFTGATAVRFGGRSATTFTVQSATVLTADVPVAAVTGPITVVNAIGSFTSTGTFTVIPTPAIGSFSPTSGPVGTVVTITGRNFIGATAVAFNGIAASSFQVVSSTSITATVPKNATTGPISVRTSNGKATSTASFTVTVPPTPPTITSFTPASAAVGAAVTITGTNLTGTTSVTFNGVAATRINVLSSTSVRALVPTGATTGKISLTTPAGTATSSGSFTVT